MMTINEKNEKPKVLVGTTAHEGKRYIIDEFLSNVSKFTYPRFDIYICDNSRTSKYSNEIIYKAKKLGIDIIVDRDAWCSDFRGRMVTSHNKLRERALKGNYDYLFILDQDILPCSNIIELLLAHNKDVVTGVYKINMGSQGIVNCCAKKRMKLVDGKFQSRWIQDSELNSGLIEWTGMIPTGCLLLSKQVLEDVVFRHDGFLQDCVFYRDILLANHKIFVDSDIMCKHKSSDWDELRKKDIKEIIKLRGPGSEKDKFYFNELVKK